MRFDWYAATIQEHPTVVVETLKREFGADEVKGGKGLHGYTRGCEVVGSKGTMARVLSGGINSDPHAWASGEDTDRFVEIVRSIWPDRHTVSRMDSAEDFQGSGAWDKLNSLCLAVADDLRLKVSQAGDYHRLEDGRTLYVGSRKSAAYIRLYEKGKQLRSRVVHGAELIPEDWCRLEVQVRPQKAAKKTAAYVTPEQAWGFAAWTSNLAQRCMDLDVPRVNMNVWREADDSRAFWFMARQYGQMLERLRIRMGGDWASVGMRIGEAIAELRQR